MQQPPLSPDEPFRLQALASTNLLDTPIEDRFERITRLARRLLDVPIAAISLVDADRQWFKSIQGLDVDQTPRSISFCGHTVLSQDMLVVNDAQADPRFEGNPLVTGDPRIRFYAGCPLKSPDGSRIASLCVIDHAPRQLGGEDLRILRDLAAIAESELCATISASLQDDLINQIATEQRRALIDPMTRLWNRQGIMNLLEHAQAQAQDTDAPPALILADIDHFKQVNDTLGHAAGDEALIEVARRLIGAVRSGDAVGRYGGEEFIVIQGSVGDDATVLEVAERLRAGVCESPIVTASGPIDVTISVGVATAKEMGRTPPESLIQAADEALYTAKRNGRNRVETLTLAGSAATAGCMAG